MMKQFFREIISLGFMQKRKTIQNNLKNATPELTYKFEKAGGLSMIFEQTGIEPNRRAETLTIDEWQQLTNLIAENE